MLTKNKLLCLVLFLWGFAATAQNVHFSQQYANRLYLNPAFAGLNHDWSISISHRTQWPALQAAFNSNQLAADLLLPNTKSAISLQLQQDRAGIGGLQKLAATAGYAYHTSLSSSFSLSAGLQATFASLNVSYGNLVFGDQLTEYGQVAITSAEINDFEPTHYISFTSGLLLYNDQAWLSLAAENLNKPAYGFNEKTTMPLRFTANTGYKFYVSSPRAGSSQPEISLTPVATFRYEKNFSYLDIGLYTNYAPLSLGLVYKSLALTGDLNQEQALAVIAGLKLHQVKVGFSHDIGISEYNRQLGGATEISVIFERLLPDKVFRSRLQPKFSRRIACPEI